MSQNIILNFNNNINTVKTTFQSGPSDVASESVEKLFLACDRRACISMILALSSEK